MDAVNILLADRERILEDCRVIQSALTDCTKIDKALTAAKEKIEVLGELTTKCIQDTSTLSKDQDAYIKKYNSLVERYQAENAKIEKLEQEKERRINQAKDISGFMFKISEFNVINEFDNRLWLMTIDSVTAHQDGHLTYKFINGLEVDI